MFLKNAREIGLESEKFPDYIGWAYEYLKKRCRSQDGLDGYFYKMFAEQNVMAKFKNSEETERRKNMAVCPVCGAEYRTLDGTCGICGFEMAYRTDEDMIKIEMKVFNLPEPEKADYRKEMDNFKECLAADSSMRFDPVRVKERNMELIGIYRKYGIKSGFDKEKSS